MFRVNVIKYSGLVGEPLVSFTENVTTVWAGLAKGGSHVYSDRNSINAVSDTVDVIPDEDTGTIVYYRLITFDPYYPAYAVMVDAIE